MDLKPALRVLSLLVARGWLKTGAKYGQKIEPTHDFQAPPPEGEEHWGRFPFIPAIGQILDLRAKSDSLNA